ncbi:hypothetical protein [Bdellovibrio sp. HCB-110]|uniref:hypothetical protein n=1 Tax=Bdellovibrio sp. HCB-110 TaxID=3391182 RepID=UPI0039B41812
MDINLVGEKMEMKRSKLTTKTEHNYKMLVAGKERILPEIIFTVSPFDGGKTISATEYKRIYSVVCAEVLSDLQTPLIYEELELLRKHFQITQSEVAKILGLDESTVSKWRKQQGALEMGNSRLLKEFFVNKLIKKQSGNSRATEVVILINGERHEVSPSGDLVASVSEILVSVVAENEATNEGQRLQSFFKNSYEGRNISSRVIKKSPIQYRRVEVADYLKES